MFHAGNVIENPATGEQITFITTAAETDGEFVIVETIVQPGGAVATKHIHPHQEERFEVLEGSVGILVGGTTISAEPGDSLVVPPGTPHKFWNAGDAEARFVCEVRPALHFEQLLSTMFALATEGKTNTHGMPNPLRLAVIAQAYSDTIQVPFPPLLVQRAALALAAPLGRMLGYTAASVAPQAIPDTPRPATLRAIT
jgi:mannose-6-phosphate isomerase-like protein (cupin superfamily)